MELDAVELDQLRLIVLDKPKQRPNPPPRGLLLLERKSALEFAYRGLRKDDADFDGAQSVVGDLPLLKAVNQIMLNGISPEANSRYNHRTGERGLQHFQR